MNIISDSNLNDDLNTLLDNPDIPPPLRRSPLVNGTYKLKSDGSTSKPGNNTNPLTKSVRNTIALVTVSASLIGAFTTISGFATKVAPLATMQPALAANVGNLAVVEKDPDSDFQPLTIGPGREDAPTQCTLKSTTMDAKLSGYVARVNVTQVFTNPFKDKIEAVYNFPLSDDSAVDDMTIKIGDRTIKGEIKTREQARQIYDQAKNVGHTAALLDQQRTNIFTQRVANIEPGKSIVVKISYVELLKFEDGKYTFSMPTTIGSRFYPGGPGNDDKNASNSLEKVLSGSVAPGAVSGQNLAINVDVDAGMPIKNVSSPLYPILVDKQNSSHSMVSLKKFVNVPNKDFVLTYELDNAKALKSGYLAYRDSNAKDKDGYATFMLLPPAKVTKADAAPKEMIFLVDCSGSQNGPPIEKAKETLHYIVDHMNGNDTFQILAFNSEVATLADQPIKAGFSEKLQAHAFIDHLTAQGGTWMAPAVERVLKHTTAVDGDLKRLRIVTFMTDGFVGNDLEIMGLIQRERGDSRWFAFGTGDSVNHTLIDNVARLGGGEAEYVLLNSSAEEVGKKFYSRISSPALTDVTLKAEGLNLQDIYPAQVSDVWANKPLYFTARYKDGGQGKVTLKGFANGRPYEQTLAVTLPNQDTKNSAIEKVWARQKIDSLTNMDLVGLQTGQMQPAVQSAITKLALDHKLMSNFTSFVAVDADYTASGIMHTIPVQNIAPEGGQAGLASRYGSAPASTHQYTGPAVSQVTPSPAPVVVAQTPVDVAQAPVVVAQAPAAPAPVAQYQSYTGSMPSLQGATNGMIGPQGSDATVISGVNTAGTTRVNNLANLEALLNVVANGLEILGIAWGGPTMIIGFANWSVNSKAALKKVLLGAFGVSGGLAAPACINWLVASARDANFFN